MRPVLALALLTLCSTGLSTSALAKGEASTDLLSFTVGSEEIAGHTLTIAPVDGTPLSTIERVEFEIEGLSSRVISAAWMETADGGVTELDGLAFEPDDGTTAEASDRGLVLTGTDCRLGGGNDLPEGVYYGIGLSDGIGDTDSDGVCDAADARTGKGGGGLCGSYDDGDSCDERAADSGFVFGQTVYAEARAAGGGGFVYGETIYMETRVAGGGGKRIVSADVGTEYCHVGVWDDTGLVHRSIAACAEIGAVSDPGGDPNKEIPKDQHFSRVWSDVVGDYVTKVVWTWGGGAIDISYHYPGMAWTE